jgi:hypothetical protein
MAITHLGMTIEDVVGDMWRLKDKFCAVVDDGEELRLQLKELNAKLAG